MMIPEAPPFSNFLQPSVTSSLLSSILYPAPCSPTSSMLTSFKEKDLRYRCAHFNLHGFLQQSGQQKNCELLVHKPSSHLIRFYVTLRSLSALKG